MLLSEAKTTPQTYIQAGAPLERVQRVQLHPSILRKPILHSLIFHKFQVKNWTFFDWIRVIDNYLHPPFKTHCGVPAVSGLIWKFDNNWLIFLLGSVILVGTEVFDMNSNSYCSSLPSFPYYCRVKRSKQKMSRCPVFFNSCGHRGFKTSFKT